MQCMRVWKRWWSHCVCASDPPMLCWLTLQEGVSCNCVYAWPSQLVPAPAGTAAQLSRRAVKTGPQTQQDASTCALTCSTPAIALRSGRRGKGVPRRNASNSQDACVERAHIMAGSCQQSTQMPSQHVHAASSAGCCHAVTRPDRPPGGCGGKLYQ